MRNCLGTPKVELHCHLLGVISPALLRKIRDQRNPILLDPDELGLLYPVSDLHSFKLWINALKPYQHANPEAMRPILSAHVESLIDQQVVYLEIMLSPTTFPRETNAFLSAFGRWREWAFAMERRKIQIEFVMVIPRTISSEALARDTAMFLELGRAKLACGVAIVGVENGESIMRFGDSIARWRDIGLGIEVHAGEHSGPKGVWDAIEHARPDRIGHALSAFADEELVQYIRSTGIHIEFCPTSNVSTGAVANLKQHPIRKARDLGIRFSLNTDDPGAFGCSMQSEYKQMASLFSFDATDFEAIFHNSLAARFEPTLRYLSESTLRTGKRDPGL